MELTVTISFVEAFPKRYGWSATRSDGRPYKASSELFGSSQQAMDAANQVFKNPAITWDWGFARHALEEVGMAVHRGHVFVSEDAATK
ncbi:MAG: hypothetical protein ABSG79_26240 [Bryobacteraceae bacterium]|jgi:hypothetical protein